MPLSPRVTDKPIALQKPHHHDDDRKPTVVEKALAQFEETCGGRDAMVKILINYHHQSDDGDLIMNLLADPRNAREPLSQLCARAGLSVGRFLNIFTSAKGSEAYLKAMDRVYPEVPEVAAEVMRSARVSKGYCLSCGGSGEHKHGKQKPKPCPHCVGTGMVEQMPDLERQKVALQLGGLLKNAPQTLIDQRTQTQVNMPVSMKSFITATNRILYGPTERVVEAEATVVESPDGQ